MLHHGLNGISILENMCHQGGGWRHYFCKRWSGLHCLTRIIWCSLTTALGATPCDFTSIGWIRNANHHPFLAALSCTSGSRVETFGQAFVGWIDNVGTSFITPFVEVLFWNTVFSLLQGIWCHRADCCSTWLCLLTGLGWMNEKQSMVGSMQNFHPI